MGATLTRKASPHTRHSLIALIALRRAKAIHERRRREAAERDATAAAETETRPKKRGWFR